MSSSEYRFNLIVFFQWQRLLLITAGLFACVTMAYATYPPSFSDCLQGDGDEYDQLEACQQLIRSNSKNYDLRVALGKTLDKRQKHKQAVSAYTKALEVFPDDAYFLKKLSIAKSNLKEKQWLKNKKQGVTSAQQKTIASSASVDFKMNKIRCLRLTGKKAMDACNKAIKINNKDAEIYVSKGDIFASQQQNNQAIISYEKALSLNPKDKKTDQKLSKLRQNLKPAKSQSSSSNIASLSKEKSASDTKTLASRTSGPQTKDVSLNPKQQQFMEQLNFLQSLKKRNLISQSEYQKRKMDLLDSTFRTSRTTETASSNNSKTSLKTRINPYAKLNFGNYYALIIGNNQYKHLNKLETAVNDAEELASVLEQHYGFKVKLLLNASRYETLKAMGELRNNLSKNDNLLIYYAGHGVLDKASERGYWLPVDAELDFTANWISTAEITDTLKALQSWHVLVVADSCYSGTLVRSAAVRIKNPEEKTSLIKRLLRKKSRTVITSGGLEPVTDSGRDNHSVFAAAFLDVLKNTDSVIEAEDVFSQIRDKVILNADQTPEYSNVRKVGHNGGDFIFLRK